MVEDLEMRCEEPECDWTGDLYAWREHPEMAERLEKAIRQRTEKVAEEMMAGPEADDDL